MPDGLILPGGVDYDGLKAAVDAALSPKPLLLDIGGGANPADEHVNVDPRHGDGEYRVAMPGRLPFDDASVDGARAWHVLEHIPSGQPRIDTFNEVHRVLKPGAQFELCVPLVGYTDNHLQGHQIESWRPWADPTHVSYWWFPDSLAYFCGAVDPGADYGIERWEFVGWELLGGLDGQAVLTKPVAE